MTGSLAYRNHEAAILRGVAPQKYWRLLPYITGNHILEIGSAEGVLACLLARGDIGRKVRVVALERSRERHEAAMRLYEAWVARFDMSALSYFELGDIADRLELLEGIDTLVAVRMIYYLGDHLDAVFAAVARKISNIVLCGNANRAASWRDGQPNPHERVDNYYASSEGMKDLLGRHGYTIVDEVTDGDPIIVARR